MTMRWISARRPRLSSGMAELPAGSHWRDCAKARLSTTTAPRPATGSPRRRPQTAQTMQVMRPKKPKPGPAIPQSSNVEASVIAAIAAMTTSASRSSMRAAPARMELAANTASAAKASTSGQRADGAMPAGRKTRTNAPSSATAAAVAKKCRVTMRRTARCASASSIDAGGDGARAGFTTGGVLADVFCKAASLAPTGSACSLVFPVQGISSRHARHSAAGVWRTPRDGRPRQSRAGPRHKGWRARS